MKKPAKRLAVNGMIIRHIDLRMVTGGDLSPDPTSNACSGARISFCGTTSASCTTGHDLG